MLMCDRCGKPITDIAVAVIREESCTIISSHHLDCVKGSKMDIHRVKSWPEYYAPIVRNIKTFDLRKDDRAYAVGDWIVFEEFKHGIGTYTGATTTRRIVYILRNFDGLMPGYCILGLGEVDDVSMLSREAKIKRQSEIEPRRQL